MIANTILEYSNVDGSGSKVELRFPFGARRKLEMIEQIDINNLFAGLGDKSRTVTNDEILKIFKVGVEYGSQMTLTYEEAEELIDQVIEKMGYDVFLENLFMGLASSMVSQKQRIEMEKNMKKQKAAASKAGK
ncbi:hypothetical protein [Culicoidibacter larvae]|uniref:Uncharacterized protein n=1 Tax=Culicoidibacter larvae TaxID=2579976 RepID=A0A5R8QDH2_9FIRM|nr:hypothetical protein [Culicoidibacter larvae]TLG75248.1 hypothetical protein FEZ08_04170 [Culicoidibacter larvae]